MNVRDLIPPILINYLKSTFRLEKEFENFNCALSACIQDAYQNAELCKMIADKTVVHIQRLEEKPYELTHTNAFLLAAINQFLTIYSKKNLTVLDFGGACGAHYFEIKRFMPENISLKWYVVETPQMVASAMDRGLNNNEINFMSSIAALEENIDIIHSSCTLHYLPDPYASARMLANLNADWLLFNRMMFNENDRDIITIQKSLLSSNGPGKLPKNYSDKLISYPHTTLSLKKFTEEMSNNHYEIEWIFDEISGSYPIVNEKIVGKGILFNRQKRLLS